MSVKKSVKKYDFKTENRKSSQKKVQGLWASDVRQQSFATEENPKTQLFQKILQREGHKRCDDESTGFSGQETVGGSGDIKDGRCDGLSEIRSILNLMKSSSRRTTRRSESRRSGRAKLKKFYSDSGLTEMDREVLSAAQRGFREERKLRSSKPKETKKKARLRDKRLGKLDSQISWIYSESSWSEESDQEENSTANSEMMSSKMNSSGYQLNEAFRDHIVRELLKQGKDLDWYIKGINRAVVKIDKQPPKGESGALKRDASVAREVSDFLIKSFRPYYRMKKMKMHYNRKKESVSQGSKSEAMSKRCRQPTSTPRIKSVSFRYRQANTRHTTISST